MTTFVYLLACVIAIVNVFQVHKHQAKVSLHQFNGIQQMEAFSMKDRRR